MRGKRILALLAAVFILFAAPGCSDAEARIVIDRGTSPPETTVFTAAAPETTVPATTAPATTAPETTAPATTAPATTVPATTSPAATAPPETEPATPRLEIPSNTTFVLNENTARIHTVDCPVLKTADASHFLPCCNTYESLLELGYIPCGTCMPEEHAAYKRAQTTAPPQTSSAPQTTASARASVPQTAKPNVRHYVLNTSRKVVHLPTCRSVKSIAEKNYQEVDAVLADLIAQGYKPCGNCHPDKAP